MGAKPFNVQLPLSSTLKRFEGAAHEQLKQAGTEMVRA
jgi:hypothetical protein